MPSTLAVVVTGAVVFYGILHLILHQTQDANEPPAVSTTFPFIGNLIGLGRKKTRYYVELRNKYALPIYTIRLPGARLYVVNSTALISSIQRQFKILAFPPLEAKAAMAVCGTSKTANDILNTNTNGEEGDWGYSMTFYKALHTPLAPGSELDSMNRIMAEKISTSMENMKGERVVQFFEFVKHEIAVATTHSVYGPQNPFLDPRLENYFWEFQRGVVTLIMGVFPSILARDSIRAREYMARAFTKYFQESGHIQGSGLIRSRFDHSTEHKIPLEDIARFEVGNTIALLSNTTPSAFWMLYHIYSNPIALGDCRKELSRVVSDHSTTDENGVSVTIRTIDISHVKSACPILLSTLQEALRFHSVGISIRMVTQDHMLDNRYLLRKGNTVMIPAPVQHTDSSAWGSNVAEFDHRRFLTKGKSHNPIAFRGFGGGTTLCPGRHFATTEILAFAAMLILRFDISPVEGKWISLTTNKAELWETTPGPDSDIKVKITSRDSEAVGVKWKVLVSDTDKVIPLSAEDL